MKKSLRVFCEILGLPAPTQDVEIHRVVLDHREVSPGDLFVAIEGERRSGREFIDQAFANGATVCMVTQGLPFIGTVTGPAIVVPDICKALQQLAVVYLSKEALKICVTGSVGKTTTKEFISILLAGSFRVGKTEKSFNSQYGFPATLLNLSGDEEILVLEMGMTNFGQIQTLIGIAPPDIAVITRIGRAQMVEVGGVQGVAKAKSEILSHPKTTKCILNYQSAEYESIRALQKEKTTLFSLDNPLSDLYLERKKGKARFCEKGKYSPYFILPFPYEHFLENMVCATAACRMVGLDWDKIIERLPLLKTTGKRFEIIEKYGITFVNDSYNAAPEAMRAAILNMPSPKKGCKAIGVLGEMPELGDESRNVHLEIAQIALSKLDEILCLGKNTEPMIEVFCENKRPATLFCDKDLLKKRLLAVASPGDVVLIKGANVLQMWKILEEI